ncbi:MAG: class II aldolase/adducin family protein [Promethearchaeota archaeon]|nr:MAG: class II aldolase/adducin family protein [Candidatus Lokiarchaeota archaeon]
MEEKEVLYRAEVVKGAKAIFNKGLVDFGEGNVSVRNGKKEELFITPSFNNYETLTEDQVVHMKFDGTPLSTGKLPSTEAIMHTMIYQSRPKAHSVIHTHSSYATMLSVNQMGIPIIMEEQVAFLGGSVDISPFGEAHTEDIGNSALKALGIKNGALLANHGVIVCGKSVEHAVKFAELIEKLAKIYIGALGIGIPQIIPEDQCDKFKKLFNSLFANYPRKMLK